MTLSAFIFHASQAEVFAKKKPPAHLATRLQARCIDIADALLALRGLDLPEGPDGLPVPRELLPDDVRETLDEAQRIAVQEMEPELSQAMASDAAGLRADAAWLQRKRAEHAVFGRVPPVPAEDVEAACHEEEARIRQEDGTSPPTFEELMQMDAPLDVA